MTFGEKLRVKRKERGLRAEDLAAVMGVGERTLSNYERGVSHPQDRSIYFKLAEFFDVDVNYFLTENEDFIMRAAQSFGARGRAQAEALIDQTAAMFAGGELSEEDQIAFVQEIQGLFFDSKQKAREKFTPKKYRIWKPENEQE